MRIVLMGIMHFYRRYMRWVLLSAVVLAGLAAGLFWFVFYSPAPGFPEGKYVELGSDLSVARLARELEEQGVVRSAFLLRAWMRVTGDDRSAHAGTYYFERPLGMLEVARRLATGDTRVVGNRVTLTEGMSAREMAKVLSAALPTFDTETFLSLAEPSEGYLFPETYYVLPTTAPEALVARLRATFDERTAHLREAAAEQSFDDIVIMASLIEKEADTPEDRRLVSGILWNRIEQGMLLQVDAVFAYIRGEPGHVPTGEDPKLDSTYNTYIHPGLPPGPIANPGLDALDAALRPAETEYFYYLTGKDGLMRYARTYEEHQENLRTYLK